MMTFLRGLWAKLLAVGVVVLAVFGVLRATRSAGRDEGRREVELDVRRAEDDARTRMDQADVPADRHDLIDRLRRR
jgi:hypothetical protein